MPNVPDVPGVPALSSFDVEPLIALVADAISPLVGAFTPTWGIFLDGENVLDADNVVDFELKQDNPVSDYPIEGGSFATYNKVQLPITIGVRVSAGGSEADRAAFLASVDSVMNTTDLYDVVTPEQTYPGYNFTHRNLSRSARSGAGLIVIDLWLTQIRETSTASFQNTQQPGDAGQQGNGNAQPQTPNAYVQQQFSSGNWTTQ